MGPTHATVFILHKDLYFVLVYPARIRLHECCSPQNNMRRLKKISLERELNFAKNHLQRKPLFIHRSDINVTLNGSYNLKIGVCKQNTHCHSIINETWSHWIRVCTSTILLPTV